MESFVSIYQSLERLFRAKVSLFDFFHGNDQVRHNSG
jgi:hypothetical protein